jgi:hypothetical protein
MLNLKHSGIWGCASDCFEGAACVSFFHFQREIPGINAYLLAQLLRRPVIHGSANLVPTNIGVRQEAFIDGRCCRQGQHDGPKWTELVVHFPSFSDILGLEGDLQAAATHAKSHGVHVDKVIRGCTVPHIIILGPLV